MAFMGNVRLVGVAGDRLPIFILLVAVIKCFLFKLWEEAGASRVNPCKHKENMQPPTHLQPSPGTQNMIPYHCITQSGKHTVYTLGMCECCKLDKQNLFFPFLGLEESVK